MKEFRRMELQLFAGDDAEDDDIEDIGTLDEEDYDLVIGDEPEKDEEEQSGEEEDENTAGEKQPAQQGSKLFTQEEVNQIVGNARIKGRELEEFAGKIHAETGLTLPQVYEEIRRLKEEEYVRKQIDEGYLSEDEARAKYRTEQENRALQHKINIVEQQQQNTQRFLNYSKEKALFYADPKIKKSIKDQVKRYEQDIDVFSGYGTAVDFKTARAYILGTKLENEDILESVRNGAEKQTIANISKRSKAVPESGSQTGGKGVVTLTKAEKIMAANFGISEKEMTEEKAKMKKKR